MTRTENQRIQQIAQQSAGAGIAPADTPLFRADVEFGRQNSMKIWDALFALRAGKPLDHSLPGVPGPRKRDHTIKGVPGEPDDDDTPEPETPELEDEDDEMEPGVETTEPCDECGGSGMDESGRPCSKCGGTGRAPLDDGDSDDDDFDE
jgi:DnaJ-class molecular chaperone